jgi:lactate dehydrogenase-like 2-hydroxyacid dehydrogenase
MGSLNEHVEAVVAPLEPRGFSEALFERLQSRGYTDADVRGVLTMLTDKVDAALLDRFPKLNVVSNMAVGVDNIDLATCSARGIPVGHTPGVLTNATADLAIALLLASSRKLYETSQDAAGGRWASWIPDQWLGSDLHGATLGIVGLGSIGTAIASRAKGFGLNILYHNRSPRPDAVAVDAQYRSFNDLLSESDYVLLAVSLSESTSGLIDTAALQKMKPSATLINIARGPVVVTEDLVNALKSGTIRAAALDVTDPEPLPADHALYQLPNCLITPHIGSATEHTRKAMAARACHNLLQGVSGQRLDYCVNPDAYSKSRAS